MRRELVAAASGDYWIGRFTAMASPCEVLLELAERHEAQRLLTIAADEAQRIDQKFSRYRDHNIVYHINHAAGLPVTVDEESVRLLDYAAQLYRLSGGRFDITAGVLRKVWRFEPGSPLPTPGQVAPLLRHVGWEKVRWHAPVITLPMGMELDLGGIGKEYAVDRAAALLGAETSASFVLNFGGDLFINRPRHDGRPWQIAVDDPADTGKKSAGLLAIHAGALATSGDARRHLLHQGRRYGHILDPRTGWPVVNAPRSITVHAPSCMEAGMLATLAMLQGEGAAAFLQAQAVPHWIIDHAP